MATNEIVLKRDNTRPHTSLVTRQKFVVPGWKLLPHSPYSSDRAPTDYHLFRFLQIDFFNELACQPHKCGIIDDFGDGALCRYNKFVVPGLIRARIKYLTNDVFNYELVAS